MISLEEEKIIYEKTHQGLVSIEELPLFCSKLP